MDYIKHYNKKYPEGLKNFVHIWVQSGIQQKIQQQAQDSRSRYPKNTDMRIIYYYNLIDKFLNTEFQDQKIYNRVNDLPQEDQLLAIDCLSWYLGMNPHNGNYHLLQIVKKYPELIH